MNKDLINLYAARPVSVLDYTPTPRKVFMVNNEETVYLANEFLDESSLPTGVVVSSTLDHPFYEFMLSNGPEFATLNNLKDCIHVYTKKMFDREAVIVSNPYLTIPDLVGYTEFSVFNIYLTDHTARLPDSAISVIVGGVWYTVESEYEGSLPILIQMLTDNAGSKNPLMSKYTPDTEARNTVNKERLLLATSDCVTLTPFQKALSSLLLNEEPKEPPKERVELTTASGVRVFAIIDERTDMVDIHKLEIHELAPSHVEAYNALCSYMVGVYRCTHLTYWSPETNTFLGEDSSDIPVILCGYEITLSGLSGMRTTLLGQVSMSSGFEGIKAVLDEN